MYIFKPKNHSGLLSLVGYLGVLLFVVFGSVPAYSGTGSTIVPVLSYLLGPEKFNALITGKLNDTGITWAGNYPSGNASICSSSTIPYQQDCNQGRDNNASYANNSNGHAGFDFVKIDSNGVILSSSATEWDCVGDNVTGLMWEVKKTEIGLHRNADRYTWYDPNPATNGGNSGGLGGNITKSSGRIDGVPETYCNTQAFTQRVNDSKLCGYSDWRIPEREELRSIIDYSRRDPSIDTDFFPYTNFFSPFGYWTATPKAGLASSISSWLIAFNVGFSFGDAPTLTHKARLVRGRH